MERLTKRCIDEDDGRESICLRAGRSHLEVYFKGEMKYRALEKLADYEDTGITPEQVKELQMDWVAMKAAYPKWIPVTGKPPKEDGTYFVTFSDGTRSTVGYGTCRMTVFGRPIGHGWYDLYTGSYYADGCIIAWMPLPEQYRE